MKKVYSILILTVSLLSGYNMKGQDTLKTVAPKTIAVEEMLGDQRQFLQLSVQKVFVDKSQIGLLSITSYAADYKDRMHNNEFQNTSLIYQKLYRGISINSGVSFTTADGLKNFAGFQLMHHSKSFSVLYLPSYFFINSHKIANTVLMEYFPALTPNWSIYSRVQLHYNHDLKTGDHFRSYAYTRIGLTHQYFSFGLAHNFDAYGAQKKTKNNVGVFLKLTL
ncbi:MAG: hypothetical protein U0X58_07740 [Flavobacteriaceae bacterium]